MAKNQEKNVNPEAEEQSEELEIQKKPGFGQKVKTGVENLKVDASLFWARNKKKVLVGTGLIVGGVLTVAGLKKFSEDGVIYDDDGEMVYESEDSEAEEEDMTTDESVVGEE